MVQIQLAQVKNKMSEYVKAVQNGAEFEITVRGVAVARLAPIAKTPNKAGFHQRVLSHMEKNAVKKWDIRAALLDGRK